MTFRPSRIVPDDREALRTRALQDSVYHRPDTLISAPLVTFDPAAAMEGKGGLITQANVLFLKRITRPTDLFNVGMVSSYIGSFSGKAALAIYEIGRQKTVNGYATVLQKVWSKVSTYSTVAYIGVIFSQEQHASERSAQIGWPVEDAQLTLSPDKEYVLGVVYGTLPSDETMALFAQERQNGSASYLIFGMGSGWHDVPDLLSNQVGIGSYFDFFNIAYFGAVNEVGAVGDSATPGSRQFIDCHIW